MIIDGSRQMWQRPVFKWSNQSDVYVKKTNHLPNGITGKATYKLLLHPTVLRLIFEVEALTGSMAFGHGVIFAVLGGNQYIREHR